MMNDFSSLFCFVFHNVKKQVMERLNSMNFYIFNSRLLGYLKGKSALMMFDKHANLKYKFGNRHFWAEGYYVSTVGLNEATIKKYIQD